MGTCRTQGEPSTSNVRNNGEKRTYHWFEYHKQWTRRKASECKKLAFSNREQRKNEKDEYKEKNGTLTHKTQTIRTMVLTIASKKGT
jgi:hypothetical protein